MRLIWHMFLTVILLAVPTIALACRRQATLTAPAGAHRGLNTFIYVYSQN